MLLAGCLVSLERKFNAASSKAGARFRELMKQRSATGVGVEEAVNATLAGFADSLAGFAMDRTVTTLALMHGLISAQLKDVEADDVRIWLDRLIQRFEVTKKVYQTYLPGFRKGEGPSTIIRLYLLFAAALCVQYVRSHNVKYLSTLLKVCDLLCSVPEIVVKGHIPEDGLFGVLAAEVMSVELLAEEKGLAHAFS
jgi:hypothetical protein